MAEERLVLPSVNVLQMISATSKSSLSLAALSLVTRRHLVKGEVELVFLTVLALAAFRLRLSDKGSVVWYTAGEVIILLY